MERIFNNVKITSSFEKSETRENLVSGETIGQHFGKIAKVIDDLENGEFNCNLTIDNALSETSENPVQNKVINAALKSKADQTTVDNALAQKANLEYVNASLTGKSDTGHTHDDRYYTETEINTKLNTKLNTSLKGTANGLAELDSSGKVPSAQLPSYVDDVLEYANQSSFPAKGESGKIYIAQDTNKTYRWSGSSYIEISSSLALGETSSTAYRGDRGKVAYDHSQTAHAPSNAQANVIETVKVNGTALTPTNKAVNITVPTVGNGTITIKQAGTTKGTFTTNQSGNTTINLDGGSSTVDNIDGIPVDLTGIYNTQMIGYDEEQGKLVPMSAVARTQTVLPSAETEAPYEITEQNNVYLYPFSSYNFIYVSTNSDVSSTKLATVKGYFKNSFLLSEFTTMAVNGDTLGYSSSIKIILSKSSDFSVIEAEYKFSNLGGNIQNADITSLHGKYFIRFEMENAKENASFTFSTLRFS